MKAVLFRQHGGPEVLEYTDFPTPEPKSGEALIHLRAAALNRMDVMVRNGWPGLKLELPHINGADGAGEVVALSPPLPEGDRVASRITAEGGLGVRVNSQETGELETRELEVGDRVVINANFGCGKCEFCLAGRDNLCQNWHLLGETIRGTYAEYVAVPLKQLYKLPDDFDFYQAAAAALVYQTAWHSLVKRGNLQREETVLIVGAGGGVNTASVQIAKWLGARVVVVGSDAKKLELAKAIGADILIDRSQEADWSKAVYLATDRRGVDVVVDNVGITFMLSLRALRKGGRLLTVGNSGAPRFEIDNRYIFAKHLSIIGSTMSTLVDFQEVMDLVVMGELKPILDKTYPLREAASAQERLWRNENFGKITLDISPQPKGEGVRRTAEG
jgi:NADPH:quinone reductase-like Zn-dependent oxidoreductase